MIISLNWLKQYFPQGANPDVKELTELIGARLVEIEGVTELAPYYQSAVVARVVDCKEHTDSDHLHVCRIDDGGAVKDVPRDDDGMVQVVCGAPNVRTGLKVIWLPPGSIVPASYGTKDELKLSSRKLRGVISYGMLASPHELKLWHDQEGILEVDDDSAQPGQSLLDLLDLDDYLLEVENKSLTHRPDCFGLIGFAREVMAIIGSEVSTPEWFNRLADKLPVTTAAVEPTVTIMDDDICDRYECVALSGIDQASSLSLQLRSFLGRSQVNSISAPVDITNYLMLVTGQPLHAFDLDQVIKLSPTGKPDIVVRLAKAGETLELIDGRIVKLDPKDVVIAVGDRKKSLPIALAGAMGGKATEITAETKRVLLESATFSLYHLRGTQFRHGIFSEAITRFTKGQPAVLTHPVLLQAVAMLQRYSGAELISQVAESYPGRRTSTSFELPVSRFTDVLGCYHGQPYSSQMIERTLKSLQYDSVEVKANRVKAVAPWWRPDLVYDEDVIEDIGRVNGYDEITSSQPTRPYVAVEDDPMYQLHSLLKDRLYQAGGNEMMGYSFIHGDLLDKVGDDKAKAFRIVNAISPRLQYCRRDLLPSLLDKTNSNLRAGYDHFMLCELGKVHRRGRMDQVEPELPAELACLAGVIVAKVGLAGAPFYEAKYVVDYLLHSPDLQVSYVRLDLCDHSLDSSLNLFEPTRSAALVLISTGQLIGVVGEIRQSVRRAFKLPDWLAGYELYLDPLLGRLNDDIAYHPISRYQGTSRDVTLQVSLDTTFGSVEECVRQALDEKMANGLSYQMQAKDIFLAGERCQNITFHLDFTDRHQTVNSRAIGRLIDHLAKKAQSKLKAKLI